MRELLHVSHLSKAFPGTRALVDVSLTVHSSEVVAIVGQNGSGKSTLVKALSGFHDPDAGDVRVMSACGETLTGSAAQAQIHTIHQDLGLIPTLNTIENLDLVRRMGRRALLPFRGRAEAERANRLLRTFGTSLDVRRPISQLSPAERTIVAIIRALSGWTRPDGLLLLDEPTASLHGDDVVKLVRVVREVADQGAGILFISHRLDEVLDIADRVVVLRDGRKVADVERAAIDYSALVRLIAGTELAEFRRRPRDVAKSAPMLDVRGVSGPRLAPLHLSVRAGEVVGVTGLLGSGREHLARFIFGAAAYTGGEVRIDGKTLPPRSPRESIKRGVALVPADRSAEGLVMGMTVSENLVLPRMKLLRTRRGSLDRRAERNETMKWISHSQLRPRDPRRVAGLLSGGNQQKVVVTKSMRLAPKVLLLDEPTQGVDVASKSMIYELIADAAAAGAAVLVSSSDTQELTTICDRVVVFREGEIALEVCGADLTEPALIEASLGPNQRLGVVPGASVVS
jgi:ABC-type sugar transport system ATPase subunit